MKKGQSFKKVLLAYASIICLLVGLLPTAGVQAANIVSISVCQAGYSTDDVKTAVVVVGGGNLSDTSYEVITSGGTKVAGGTMTSYSPSGWSRGETYYKIDFTSVTQTGDFKIKTNGTTSVQFKISENIWTDYTDEMVEMYRIQRCGQDTNQALNGFNNKPSSEALHAACHTDDAKASNGQRVDMTGGWHDAGDNNKYGANTGWLIGTMAITYMRHTKADFDYDNNGTPDLLDEVRYGADSMVKILASTGNTGVYDIIDAPNGQQYWWNYPTNESGRIAHSRNAPNPLTYDATMKTAGGLAAVARAFETEDPAFSEKCKNAAIGAYKWANSNTGNKGGWYEAKNQNGIRFWAAVQLYKLTSDASYKSTADSFVNGLGSVSASTNYWGLEPISLAEYYDVCDTSMKNKVVTLLEANSDKWINSMINPFGVSGLDSKCDFGINEPNISNAADTYRLYEITGDTKYRDAAVKAAQWTFGVNPWDISWVAGIGNKYPVHPHTRLDADADKNAGSTMVLPGFMICGPIWNDPLTQSNAHPWYEDRSLADDGKNQWKHNEFSISIQYGLLDLVVAMAYKADEPTPSPTPTLPPTSTPAGCQVSGYIAPDFPYAPAYTSLVKSGYQVQIVGTGFSAVTDGNGYFSIKGVEAKRSYTLKIEKDGFLARTLDVDSESGDVTVGTQSSPVNVWAGDVKVDGAINISDVMEIARAFNTTSLSPQYNDIYDFDKNGAINISDVIIVASHFNKTASDYPSFS